MIILKKPMVNLFICSLVSISHLCAQPQGDQNSQDILQTTQEQLDSENLADLKLVSKALSIMQSNLPTLPPAQRAPDPKKVTPKNKIQDDVNKAKDIVDKAIDNQKISAPDNAYIKQLTQNSDDKSLMLNFNVGDSRYLFTFDINALKAPSSNNLNGLITVGQTPSYTTPKQQAGRPAPSRNTGAFTSIIK